MSVSEEGVGPSELRLLLAWLSDLPHGFMWRQTTYRILQLHLLHEFTPGMGFDLWNPMDLSRVTISVRCSEKRMESGRLMTPESIEPVWGVSPLVPTQKFLPLEMGMDLLTRKTRLTIQQQ